MILSLGRSPFRICILLIISSLEAHAVSKLAVMPSAIPNVTLTQFDEITFPKLSKVFESADGAGMRPAAAVVLNSSDRTILAISVVWVYTDSAGRQTYRSLRSDSFSSPAKRPVAMPHSKLLVTPSMILPESLVDRAFLATTVSSQREAAAIAASSAIAVELDLVIFDDGEVDGPDRRHYIAELQARKLAASSVVQDVRSALAKGESSSDVISLLCSAHPEIGNYFEIWKLRFAQRLLRSHNLQLELNNLEQLPMLPNLHRKQ